MEKMILIDGNSLLNRAFYATPLFTTKNGLPTNGVFGFIKFVLKIISDKNPAYLAVAFDLRAPTFRHKMYTGYKLGRKPMPEELVVQIPVLKDVLKIMGIKICELEGYEADDVIGTLSKRFNVQTYVYTGDRDAYQLVSENTAVCYTKKGVSDILELTNENFFNELGLIPAQIIDLKALMGDKSDNIPGVAGIGEKSALSLLKKYKDLDGIYANLDELSDALNRKLSEGRKSAYFSKELATIDVNAPIDISLEECKLKMPFPCTLKEKFTELEFKSLTTKNIYEEKKETPSDNQKASIFFQNVVEIIPEKVEYAVSAIENYKNGIIACYFSEKEFRFLLLDERGEEYVFPIRSNLMDVGFDDYQLKPVLTALFNNKNTIIAYNVKELFYMLKSFDIAPIEKYEDVSILKCLSDGLANTDSLEYCLNYFALSEKHKAFGVYNLWKIYTAKLNRNEKKLYKEVELPLIRVLFDMEIQGVCVDLEVLYALSARYDKEIKDTVQRIYVLAGEEFNVNSTKQLGAILFEKLKIATGVKKKKESDSYKTTAEELEKYADNSEIVRQILRYRKLQKIHSTYIEGFKPLIRNGKVHTTYNQSNTLTGRLSSANPNLQNIPIKTEEGRELRKLFIASPGNVLIDADYSQIELRLLAHFSKCKKLLEAYNTEQDIHQLTASQVFNVPVDQVTSSMRREAKAVNFGIIYGISAFGLANDLHITAKKAKDYIEKYFERYPEVKKYMNSNVEKAMNDGYVETLLGRRRVVNEIRSSNFNIRSFGERAAMNMPLQGSSADIIKIAMINVQKKLKEQNSKAKLVLQVHDELIIDCPEAEAENIAELLREEMKNAVKLNVPLTVGVGIGKNWFEIK